MMNSKFQFLLEQDLENTDGKSLLKIFGVSTFERAPDAPKRVAQDGRVENPKTFKSDFPSVFSKN